MLLTPGSFLPSRSQNKIFSFQNLTHWSPPSAQTKGVSHQQFTFHAHRLLLLANIYSSPWTVPNTLHMLTIQSKDVMANTLSLTKLQSGSSPQLTLVFTAKNCSQLLVCQISTPTWRSSPTPLETPFRSWKTLVQGAESFISLSPPGNCPMDNLFQPLIFIST